MCLQDVTWNAEELKYRDTLALRMWAQSGTDIQLTGGQMRPELRVSVNEPGLDPEQEPPGAAGNQETLSQGTPPPKKRGKR